MTVKTQAKSRKSSGSSRVEIFNINKEANRFYPQSRAYGERTNFDQPELIDFPNKRLVLEYNNQFGYEASNR